MANYQLLFSPTGGCRRAADLLSARLGADWQEIDLCKNVVPHIFSPDDLCLVTVPSYGGRVPAVATERLKALSGNGAKAILLCVYGNRAYEDTLSELQDTLTAAGFLCVAAAATIAEHSIVRQFAAGRPDAGDASELAGFAEKIAAKLSAPAPLPPLPGSHGTYKPTKPGSLKPDTNADCISCGVCVEGCPVDAISLEEGAVTDKDACISCMRCISLCPQSARRLDPTVLDTVTTALSSVCSSRKENELFV